MNDLDFGIWLRVSTDEQAQGESPKTHLERATYYCKAKGWNIAETYDLSGVSGKSVLEHPEAQRMLADIKAGRIKGLVFSKLARLARNTKDLLEISDIFQKYDASLVSIEESIDTSTPAGRLLYTVIGALAQWEREEISARVAASVPIRAQRGLPTGGIGPFGYHWLDKSLVPNPAEAPTVRRAFQLFLETKKVLTTANMLNNEGLRARKSAWGTTTLKRLLVDPVYRGERRANYTKSKGGGRSWVIKDEKDWVFTEVEPLVTPEVWGAAQAVFRERAGKVSKGIPKETSYMFGGLLRCHCGTKMYVLPYKGMKTPRYICRTCRNKINEDAILAQLLEAIKTIVVSPEQVLFSKAADEEKISQRKDLLQSHKRDLLSIRRKIDLTFDLLHDGTLSKGVFTERYQQLNDRKEQIEADISRIEVENAIAQETINNRGFILQQAENLMKMWDIFTTEEKAEIVREIVETVVVGPETLTFSINYLSNITPLCKDDHTSRDSWRRPA
ncbi:recombinase family protein [Geomonas sp. Red69]|uniref:recombinase family protein n=1 Tax=Geomonas diazotrophica TaxID=2843197 RepID=UPI001C100535|nr:recombinase family protein [Geomonas diazotrophica]MBU5637991.1 recombinase family protein [Geomonas diazotrophica]